MKIHPVHIMIVHFPAALFPVDLLFSIAALYFPGHSLEVAAYYALLAGVAGGWLALLTGLLDFLVRLLKHGSPAVNRGLLHAGVQSVMLTGFTVVLSLEHNHAEYITAPPLWLWSVKAVLLGSLIYGNYLGGDLLLKYIAKEFDAGNNPS